MSDPPIFSDRAAAVEKLLASDPIIRAVNFHNTSRAQSGKYERQLAHYGRYFSPVNEDDLNRYLVTGRWHKSKPGLIVAVYEGYRNSYEVLAPLLDQNGFDWLVLHYYRIPKCADC